MNTRYSMKMRMSLLAIAAAMTLPAAAQAQGRFSVDARGGIAIPASDLADLQDVGASAGVGLSYDLTRRLAVRVDGDVDILSGADSGVSGASAPDFNVFHYGAGLALGLIDPASSPWNIVVNAGAGASTFDSDTFTAGGTTTDFSETYFTANGGLRVAYDVSSTFGLFVQGQAFLMFTDEEDTAIFNQINSEVDPAGFDTAWTIPITAGFSLAF